MIQIKSVRTGYHERGSAMVEMAIILPLMLLLVLGIVDFGRAIQYNNILVSISREGGNLASRTTESTQNIIKAIINTAGPLDMTANGMMFVTEIVGRKLDSACVNNCQVFPLVRAQTKALSGEDTLTSRVWSCPTSFNQSNGSCIDASDWADASQIRPSLPVTLADGEVVYAVEALYDYPVIIRYVMKTGPQLYSLTIL